MFIHYSRESRYLKSENNLRGTACVKIQSSKYIPGQRAQCAKKINTSKVSVIMRVKQYKCYFGTTCPGGLPYKNDGDARALKVTRISISGRGPN